VLKKEAFADVISIAINFIVRASAGAFIIGVLISPWLILVVFFLALFLTLGKRKSDLIYLGEYAGQHKPSLKNYSREIIDFLMIISTSALVITYSLYCTLGRNPLMLFTLPITLYALFRYTSLVYSGSEIGRQPHKVFKDWRIVFAILLWIAVSALVLYSSITLEQLLP
jgi:4-hydroxybenzoate polyprenyltransferase